MLRFQNALAAAKWTEALKFCSYRVQVEAAKWPTEAEFFRQTMPVEDVLAQSFGCWSCGEPTYGLFVNLTAPTETSVVQWYWAIVATNGAWVVDYPPVKLDKYVSKKKAWLKQRDDELARIRRELDSQVQNLKVKLTATSKQFVIGQPMLFKVELFNPGKETVEYRDCGIRVYPLKVRDEQKEPLAPHVQPAQLFVHTERLAPSDSIVLVDGIDLEKWYSISKAGKYMVRFDGSTLDVGKQLPIPFFGPGLFNENETLFGMRDFIEATTKVPSNIVEIQIVNK